MNRLGFCFGSGEAGTDGIGVSGEQSVADLDVDVRPVVEEAADGDVRLRFRSADDGARAEVSVQLDDAAARTLLAALEEQVGASASVDCRRRTLPNGEKRTEATVRLSPPDAVVDEARGEDGAIDHHALSDRISVVTDTE